MGWLDRPKVMGRFNPNAELPYGLTLDDVRYAIEYIYDVLNSINKALVERIGMRMEELLRPNAFADLISTLAIRGISEHSNTVTHNRKHDGFPDLLPICNEEYRRQGYYIHYGDEGIEVKASKQKGGWQGHNPEGGWFMIFRYEVDRETMPMEERRPTQIVEVLIAKLTKDDWSFSGRKGKSRRTITASIRASGVKKLRDNWVYRL